MRGLTAQSNEMSWRAMTFYGEATYWHNHPDLPRLAQNVREQMELQRMAVCENLARRP